MIIDLRTLKAFLKPTRAPPLQSQRKLGVLPAPVEVAAQSRIVDPGMRGRLWGRVIKAYV